MSEHSRLSRVLEDNPALLAQTEVEMAGTDARRNRGAELLRDVERFVTRFVVLPKGTVLPLALWTIGTHVFDAFETFPYLALLSPEKGCGKTRTTEVLEQVVAEPVRAISISEAALFRLVHSKMPTLILDETEVLTGKGERAEAIRALLNAGNRAGAKVPRCVGNSHELRFFNVYCPKVISAIRLCPETIRDRSIVVPMQRKKPGEDVERFILRRIRPEGEELRQRVKEWTEAARPSIVEAYERLDVDFLSDRDLENFEPLLALLTVADPSRLAELRRAAESLTARKAGDAQDESLSLRLLADVRDVWPENEHTILTTDLLCRLKGVEDAPWSEEVPLSPRKLAKMLRPYEILPAGTVRVGDRTGKGYRREEAEAPFVRYLTPEGSHGSQSA